MIGTESFINITPCPQWVKLDFAGQNEAENWYLADGICPRENSEKNLKFVI